MRPESAADNTVDSQSKSAKLSGSRDLSVARAGSGHVPQAQKQAHLLVNDASTVKVGASLDCPLSAGFCGSHVTVLLCLSGSLSVHLRLGFVDINEHMAGKLQSLL